LQCGYENADDSRFCIRCGSRLTERSEGGEQMLSEEKSGLIQGEAEANVSGNDGAENKIGAEWQGADCRYAYGQSPECASPSERESERPLTTANGTPISSPGFNSVYENRAAYFSGADGGEAARRRLREAKAINVASRRKTLFVLAFVGLLLDFLCGIGALMCLPTAIIASVDLRKLYKTEKKTSTQLVWATVVGYLGVVLGVLFLFLMIR